ncbi:MAG: copper chaperone PCu(A)C [Pseudomonadota bacterium]
MRLFPAFAVLLLCGAPAIAGGIMIEEPYARASFPGAANGAAFMRIMNHTGEDDRLIGAESDISERVELHTHVMDGDVARMVEDEDGFEVTTGDGAHLTRGGDHIMFIGLKEPLEQDATVTVNLIFEKAGRVEVTVPVDFERVEEAGGHGHGHGHSHDHGDHGDHDVTN